MAPQRTINKRGGYVALISAVVITFVLTGLAYMVARSGFFSRFDSLNAEYKRVSKGLAESCANQALLKLAQDPKCTDCDSTIHVGDKECNIDSVNFDPAPGTGINGDYDSEHKKTANIVASAHYPDENGAYSRLAIKSTVYDPQFAPPARVVVNGFVSGSDEIIDSFILDGPDSYEVQSGDVRDDIDAGSYTVVENEPGFDVSDYDVSATGDCELIGSDIKLAVVANTYKACNVIYTLKSHNARLTVIIVAASDDGTVPEHLAVNGGPDEDVDAGELTKTFEIEAGTGLDVAVAVNGLPGGYGFSSWGGEVNGAVCSGSHESGNIHLKNGDNAVCAIAVGKKSSSSRAAVTVVTRVVNNYEHEDGLADAVDFPVTVDAQDAGLHSESISADGTIRTQVYYINPGNFKITQGASAFTYYAAPEYSNCEGNAANGQGYLCLIANKDIPTSFTMTATVNVTQAYGITAPPAYALSLVGLDGKSYGINSGQPISLPAGIYTLNISGTGDYLVSNWGPYSDCIPAGSKTATITWTLGDADRYRNCAINISENQPAVLKVVTQVVNNYNGKKVPADFSTHVTAEKNLVLQSDTSGTKTYYMAPGDFEVVQDATPDDNYAPPEYQETAYPRLCRCKAAAGCVVKSGQSYVCVVTNRDKPKTFYLMATVNVTRGYNIAPIPNYTVKANPGNADLTAATQELAPGTYTVGISGIISKYSVSEWGGDCAKDGTVSWNESEINDRYKNCAISVVENPPPFNDVDTVLMLDRTGSMFSPSTYISAERTAAKSFLNQYSALSAPRPQVGIGVFANDSGASAQIVGTLTDSYGGENPTSLPTAILTPNGQGNYTAWQYGESTIDETGNASCSNSDSIISSTTDNRESVRISLNSIPNGATITDAVVTVYDRAGSVIGGTYKTFVRLNNINFDAASDLSTTANSGCAARTQSINFTDTAKSNSTSLEIGVLKTGTNTGEVRIGAIRAVINYNTMAATGLYLAINNGLASSHGGTDISAAITKGGEELNSTRHIAGHKKYLIMLSDGQPTLPNGGGYNITQQDITAAVNAANNAKTNKGPANDYVTEIYTIHFGSVVTLPNNETSQNLLSRLATESDNKVTVSPSNSNYLSQVASENDDKDHFFIVPESADPTAAMTDIFNKIGQQIIEASAPPTATTGKLSVMTYVYNENGGTDTFKDFPVTITSNGASQTFDPRPTAKITVTLDPGSYSVAETSVDGYTKTMSQCAGDIAAGQEITCVIVNDDSAPDDSLSPPPEPSAPPTATTGTLNIATYVFSSDGTKTYADFPVTVTNNGASQVFDPRASAKLTLTIEPGAYSVSEASVTGYTKTMSQCSGTIAAGQTIPCIIIEDNSSASGAPYSYGGTIETPEDVTLPPTVIVVTRVSNSDLYGDKTPADFTLTTNNPPGYPPFKGTESGKEIDNMTVGPYNIDAPEDSSYVMEKSGCNDTISENEIKTCVIVYTALSHDIIPIKNQQNITIDGWIEE